MGSMKMCLQGNRKKIVETDVKKEYKRWLANADVAVELKTLDDAKIADVFYCDLVFGISGLRGGTGTGTKRMNVYTVAKASQDQSDCLKKLCSAAYGGWL